MGIFEPELPAIEETGPFVAGVAPCPKNALNELLLDAKTIILRRRKTMAKNIADIADKVARLSQDMSKSRLRAFLVSEFRGTSLDVAPSKETPALPKNRDNSVERHETPSTPWGPFTSDLWSPILVIGTEQAFAAAAGDARRHSKGKVGG